MSFKKAFPWVWLLTSTIALLSSFFWIDEINTWAGTYEKFVTLQLALLGVFVFPVIAWLLKGLLDGPLVKEHNRQQEIKKFRSVLGEADRELFRENHRKIEDALTLIKQHGGVKDEAMSMIWSASSQASLELPDDIMEFTESVRALAQDAWACRRSCFDHSGQPVDFPERQQLLSEMHEAERQLYNIEPTVIYRTHLAVEGNANGNN